MCTFKCITVSALSKLILIMFNELVNEISKDIQKHEQRSRLRTTEEQFTKSR